MTEGFGLQLGDLIILSLEIMIIEKKITKNTAAIMVEPIMGEGVLKLCLLCLKGLRKLCNKKILLIR